MVVADLAFAVNEVVRGPVFVVEGLPDFVIAINGDGIGDLEVAHGLLYVGALFFEGEFGGVDADYHQACVFIFRGPAFDVGERAEAVDAGVGPEINYDNLAAEAARGLVAAN